MRRLVTLFLLGLCGLAAADQLATTPPRVDGGCIVSRDTDLTGVDRLRILGPFIERSRDTRGRRLWAFRPLFSRTLDPAARRGVTDIVWPLGMFKTFLGQRFWRLLVFFGHDFDTAATGDRYRVVGFPFIFWGRDISGDPYFGLFPLGGAIHEFLGQDRVRFWFFPLYLFHAVGQTRTHHWLWPLISRTTGPSMSRLRFFPFYSRSENRRRGIVNRFVLWPIWSSVKINNDKLKGGGFVLFPLFGYGKSGAMRTWMVLPPFFRYTTTKAGCSLHCPWPFFQRAHGEMNKLYLWPLWGRREFAGTKKWFFLWPVVGYEEGAQALGTKRRFFILPLFFHEWLRQSPTADDPAGEAVLSRSVKLWPLAMYRRDGDTSLWRVPTLWPLRQTPAIERNWAPLWTLYSRTRVGDAREDELLWGLFRYRRDAEGMRRLALFPLFSFRRDDAQTEPLRQWSFLFGSIRCRREGLRKSYRVLYFLKFGGRGEP